MTGKLKLIYFLETLIIFLCLFSVRFFSYQKELALDNMNEEKKSFEAVDNINKNLLTEYENSISELENMKKQNFSEEELLWKRRVEEISGLLHQ